MEHHSKKKQFYDPRQKTPRVNVLTQEYHQALSAVEADDVFFLDEMGAVLNLTSDYGRAPKNERVYGARKCARESRVSTVGALSTSGIQSHPINLRCWVVACIMRPLAMMVNG